MTGRDEAIEVVLVDDHLLLRRSLASLIDAEPGLAVVGEAGDGIEALEVVAATRPQVVLMDVRMPRLDGIETTRRICRDPALTGTRVLVLSMFELDEYVYQAIRAGASGFLLKDSHPADLIAAVFRTHAGESLLAPAILTRLIEHFLDASPQHAVDRPALPAALNLTDRETEVLGLVGRGLSNDQIAVHLGISIKTVKTHVSNLLGKLGARDRTHLVIAAYDIGLVTPRKRPPERRN